VVVEEEGEVVVVVLRGIVIDGCVAVLLKSWTESIFVGLIYRKGELRKMVFIG